MCENYETDNGLAEESSVLDEQGEAAFDEKEKAVRSGTEAFAGENDAKEEGLSKKQIVLLTVCSVIFGIAFIVEIISAICFGDVLISSSKENNLAGLSLVVLLPMWIIFGCTTSLASIIFSFAVIKPLGKLRFIPLIYIGLICAITGFVIGEIAFFSSASSSTALAALAIR